MMCSKGKEGQWGIDIAICNESSMEVYAQNPIDGNEERECHCKEMLG